MPDPEHFRLEQSGVLVPMQARGKNLVELTGHAVLRMKERSISRADVLHVVVKETATVPTEPGRVRLTWQKTARTTIDVVIEERKDRILVITVIVKTKGSIRRSRK